MSVDCVDNGEVPLNPSAEALITVRVADIAERRGVIEHAKGMLMLLHGLDADEAFDLLKWRSQETNTNLRSLAAQLVSDFRALSGSKGDEYLPSKDVYDQYLMTADKRVAQSAAAEQPLRADVPGDSKG